MDTTLPPQGYFPSPSAAALIDKYMHWTPEWKDQDPYGPFPLRELAPDIIDYLASSCNFTARDIRTLCEEYDFPVEAREKTRFFERILERVEEHPFTWGQLEWDIARIRSNTPLNRKPTRAEIEKTRRVLQKFPIMRFGLAHRPDYQARLSEFEKLPPYPADLIAAVFFDYAFQHMQNGKCLNEAGTLASIPRSGISDPQPGPGAKKTVPASLRECLNREEWSQIPELVLTGMTVETVTSDQSDLLVEALQSFAATLFPDSPATAFEDLSELSLHVSDLLRHLRHLQEEAQTKSWDPDLLARAKALGLDIDPDREAPAEVLLSGALAEALDEIERHDAEISALGTRIAKLRQDVTDLLGKPTWTTAEMKIFADDIMATEIRTSELSTARDATLARAAKVLGLDTTPGRSQDVSSPPPEPETTAESSGRTAPAARETQKPKTKEKPPAELVADARRASDREATFVQEIALPGPTHPASPEITPKAQSLEVLDEIRDHVEGPDLQSTEPVFAEAEDLEEEITYEQAPLRRLLAAELPGIAAELAARIEEAKGSWGIDSDTLQVAAATRVFHDDYGSESDEIRSLASKALSRTRSDLGSILLFGALVRPLITRKSLHDLRGSISELCRGSLGPHLIHVAEAVASLDYDFPPSAEMMGRLAGVPSGGAGRRTLQKLRQWCETVSRKKSRWAFASLILRHIASEQGPIGKAVEILASEAPDAPLKLRAILDQIDGLAEIEILANDLALERGKMNLVLHAKAGEYLHALLEEPRILITGWLEAREAEAAAGHRTETRMQQKIENLQSRITRALSTLETPAREKNLKGTIANWVSRRLQETLDAIRGRDSLGFSSAAEALRADLDFLPAPYRQYLVSPNERLDRLWAVVQAGIPAPEEAVRRACAEGAFETASRISERYGLEMETWIQSEIATFAQSWIQELTLRERQLKTISKVDYDHQEELARHLGWGVMQRTELQDLLKNETIGDFTELGAYIVEVDEVADRIEVKLREDQIARIKPYLHAANGDEAEALLAAIDDLSVEAIEDRIAQLRDGRSAAAFDIDLEGVITPFTEKFLLAASAPDWPHTIDEDRRGAASEFIGLYLDLQRSLSLPQPNSPKLRQFLEEIGFESIRLSKLTQIGRNKAWQVSVEGQITSDGWFLPPVFGSLSKGSYNLVLVGTDTLPEAIQKNLMRDMPNLLLLAGVADPARRREFAERLRSNQVPAILIDEALVAYSATLRETRAQTIFECGLPYGRVEPYTTDAGSMPEEMFFGREQEIQTILSQTADGCLVYGGRQLGKSAFLAQIEKLHHDPDADFIVVRREVKPLGNSEKTSAIWSHLHQMLSGHDVVRKGSRDYESITRDIRNWLTTHRHGRILCLFDETDHFMTAETREDYPELSRLKELMETTGRAFKVVFAGLHNVKRIHKQPNSPLAHLQAICIGPLNRTEDDKRAAHDIVVQPMRAAGFRFESVEAVEEILAWANYYPSLVQEYAKGLLATLHGAGSGKAYRLEADGPLWTIPTRDLFAHRGFQQIETRVREKFHLTLDLDPRYALVAYTLAWLNTEGFERQALVTGFPAQEILDHAKGFWPKMSQEPSQAAFDVLLDELFELGVLGRVPVPGSNRFTYCLRTRQVASMLGSHEDITHALTSIHEKEPTVAYERSIHRRRYGQPGKPLSAASKDWLYSPLTDLQIERLLSRDHPDIRMVCGLEFLGLTRISAALRWLYEQGNLPGRQRSDPRMIIETADSGKALANIVEQSNIPENTQLVVLRKVPSLKDAEQEIRWLSDRSRVQYGDVIPVLLLNALDPELRDLASRRSEQTEYLSAWGSEMLRIHLFNAELGTFDTKERRKEILHKTGGIPSEVITLVDQMKTADVVEDVLGDWAVSPKLLKGLDDQPLLKALDCILETSSGEDYSFINELLVKECKADLTTIGPDLQAVGLISGWNPKAYRIRRSELGDLVAANTNR
jgi:hypothetical protein